MPDADDHVLHLLDAYLHDALAPRQAAEVERHCQDCRVCRVALEEARSRFDALQALPMVEAPEELIQATRGRIERAPRWKLSRPQKGFLAAAAAAVLIACVQLYYLNLAPSAYDLKVLGQTRWLAGSRASLRVLLVRHDSGQPVQGAPVEIDLIGKQPQQTVRLASFTTDHLGTATPRLKLPDWEAGEYRLVVRAQAAHTPEVITRRITLRRSWRLMLSSDKPVYQPGQVIHLRSLALRQPDLKPVTGREAVFSISDPKGNVIFRQRDVTSRFGIASSDCPLATEILEGTYQVRCRVDDTSSSLSVEVQKYVLPRFKIEVELDRPYYQPGQRARGTVQVDYFFGKPVEGAEVRIAVRSMEVRPTTVQQLALKSDAEGAAAFEFGVPESLIGRPQDAGDARIWLDVTVRDSAGQEQSKTVSRRVAALPIRIEVIPEAGSLVLGVANRIYFFTSYPDGRPAPTQIAVSDVDRELITNQLGVALLELVPESPTVRWTVRATDGEGKVGRREIRLDCGPPSGDFLVRTDKAVYQGGQTVHVLALGGGVEPVLIDLIKDGQTVLTDVIEMRDGRGQYQFDLPPELFGTIRLSAYRFGSRGLPVGKSRVIYVRQAGELQIKTALDKTEYRPGQRAQISFTLTDDQGRPAPGAVSLVVVDEAVFSVLGQRPALEQTFFTLEEELLEPIYAVYNWSPDLGSRLPEEQLQGLQRLEQAVFARTARSPGRGNVFLRTAHSLEASSFPAKARQVRVERERGLQRVAVAWVALGVVSGIGLLVLLCRAVPILGAVAVALVFLLGGVVVLAALLLPAVQATREAPMAALRVADTGGAAAPTAEIPTPDMPSPADEPAAPPRVRRWFPETLFWRPELITDDKGRASIELDLADSITSWRLSASAVNARGKLGGSRSTIRVFQPFFVDLDLPVALTRGDEAAVPVVVYNYLARPQTVRLELAAADWFELVDDRGPVREIELQAGEVRSLSYRLRAGKVGHQKFQVEARGAGVADAVEREIEVVPDGSPVEQLVSGTLEQPAQIDFSVPPEAIPGSVKAFAKIYPSTFSQLVEGLEAIFRRPYGCFEQTSSTTYPNVLALDYLRQTRRSVPEVELKARQYIHLGYQRLLSFEIPGGGFDWFGRPPAHRTLTAYGLMEFQDMARVHDVDPTLLKRTREWLLGQQLADGSWQPENRIMEEDPVGRQAELARLTTTAYIAWAVFARGADSDRSQRTLDYLLAHEPAAIDDPYVLALLANALLAIDPQAPAAGPYLERLELLKRSSPNGKQVWWEQAERTVFHGRGTGGAVETTALATLAMIRTGTSPQTARRALAWLLQQKDARGTWHSTQATVLALKALLAGSDGPLGGEQLRRIEIVLDGQRLRELAVPADQGDVMQQVDLSGALSEGTHRLTLSEPSDTASGYQVAIRYHVPDAQSPVAEQQPLSIQVAYDKTQLRVSEMLTATATVVNNLSEPAPMVILDLPIPAGFAVEREELDGSVEAGTIARYQLTPRSAIIYLLRLKPSQPLVLRYRLRATMPVKVTAPPARAYEYYDPESRGVGAPGRLTVLART